MRGTNRPILNDNLGEDFEPFLKAALTPMARTAKGRSIAMSSSELDTLQATFRAAGGKVVDLHHLGQEHLHAGALGLPAPVRARSCTVGPRAPPGTGAATATGDVWQTSTNRARMICIRRMKPVELVERAIRNSSRPGDVVLDPFGGFGTTLIAPRNRGRQARLIELDPRSTSM